jgi:hypothetical protein
MQGVLELGGGSLQVTFLPAIPPPSSEASPLDLPSLGPGRLYSRSFDGLGLQVNRAAGWWAHRTISSMVWSGCGCQCVLVVLKSRVQQHTYVDEGQRHHKVHKRCARGTDVARAAA